MKTIESLYKKYGGKIYNLAYRMTGNGEDAGDITQETFIRAHNSLDQFRSESSEYTWLYKIAKNICLRMLEKKKKSSFLSMEDLISKSASPVSSEITEEEKSLYILQVKDGCLSGLLRCLSFHQRLVFILNVLFDLPVEQVAGIVDKSENATHILVHRSKKNIKEFLCKNCSLYDSKNTCRCENLVNFSLKNNWIARDKKYGNIERAETEIKDLKNVVHLYKSLDEISPAGDFKDKIRQLLTDKENYLILSEKKVK